MELLDAKMVRRKELEDESGVQLSDCIECAVPIRKGLDFFPIDISEVILNRYAAESYKSFCAGELETAMAYANSIKVIKTLRKQCSDTEWIIVFNF